MNIFKNILTALGVILIIAFAGIYFLPDTYTVTESIEINKPANLVFEQVCNFKNWSAWSPWHAMEPEAVTKFSGKPGKEGHTMSWEGEKIGTGTLTIATCKENEQLEGDLSFLKPFKSIAKDKWEFKDNGATTTVTWISEGPLSYPLGRVMGLSMDEMVGEPKRQGLQKLKEICESMNTKEAQQVSAADSMTAAMP